MGRRDYRKREKKKAKKDVRKTVAPIVLQPEVSVEIIKKGKRKAESEEEEK